MTVSRTGDRQPRQRSCRRWPPGPVVRHRRRVAGFVAIVLVTANCSSDGSSPDTPPADHVQLDVLVGTTDGPTIARASLTVDDVLTITGTGFLAPPASASAAAASVATSAARDRLLHGAPTDRACDEIYGSRDVATVTGSIGGQELSTSFNRADGCGIADWTLIESLIGRPRWDGGMRVVQWDEDGVDAVVGDRLIIELASNATTGHAWEPAVEVPPLLRQVDHQYLASDGTLVGAGGYERFTFEALASGSTLVTFEYRRPSDPKTTPPGAVERFLVTVTPSTS